MKWYSGSLMMRHARWMILLVCSCTAEVNIHETKQAKSTGCINCHSAAYVQVMDPPHMGIKPVTCGDCHGTSAWVPTMGAAGHPEDRFPIQSGKHRNMAIGCTDCHIASLGPSTGGMNTDCIHCHIGAHTIASIDRTHVNVGGYVPANSAMPHSCLDCHPTGMR